MQPLPDYEKIGSFYLGKRYELNDRRLLDDKVLYDSRDLLTHALCVGMTGSGKTGLCTSLLEEAAIDGIPAICLDPKGDLGNLLLAFPNLAPADFRPWVESSEAARRGLDLDQYAAETARAWREGLSAWDQPAERIGRYRESVDRAIYTPGSTAGIPLTLLKSFEAPPPQVIDDADMLRERVSGAASAVLTLLGIEADPLHGREHILLSHIFDASWRKAKSLDVPGLIRAIQTPPLEKIGVFDLESFYPRSQRQSLAMSLNNLMASPAFAGWLEGQPLEINRLLYTNQGQPRLSIISIAHLSDRERMFFVTILLNELLAWMRLQPGTSSLRALLYMDEIYGFFPPSAMPPSKSPMLMLLKQARAFGLGIILATQNPADLDYKGLSNMGTWFLGRLQTARDKERLLDGLQGAALRSDPGFERAALDQTLSALGNRVFLMHNVHDDRPTVFQTRWAMSYLRGPLTRQQIQTLMDPRRRELTPQQDSGAHNQSVIDSEPIRDGFAGPRPIIPHEIEERFWLPSINQLSGNQCVYRPAVVAKVSCHYVRVGIGIDAWVDMNLLAELVEHEPGNIWLAARRLPEALVKLGTQPEAGYSYSPLPTSLLTNKWFKRWAKELADHCYRHLPTTVYECPELKMSSQPGQNEAESRIALSQRAREVRDERRAALRDQYAEKVSALTAKIRAAQERLAREQAQFDKEKWDTAINFGQTMLGWLVGNKSTARGSAAGRSFNRAAQERAQMRQADATLDDLIQEKRELELRCAEEITELGDRYRPEALTLKPLKVPCRKGDTRIELLALVWIPCEMHPNGTTTPLVTLPG